MKIALVYSPLTGSIHAKLPPVGLGYLTAFLKQGGHKVFSFNLSREFTEKDESDIYNLVKKDYHVLFPEEKISDIQKILIKYYEKRIDKIINTGARVIGFSVYFAQLGPSLLLAKMIKERDKSRIIVFGGPECLHSGNEILKKYDFVDAVVIGEGEITLNVVINSIEKKVR